MNFTFMNKKNYTLFFYLTRCPKIWEVTLFELEWDIMDKIDIPEKHIERALNYNQCFLNQFG